MLDPLLFDLVEWIAKEQRSYSEVMEAWRTSCPRLPVWETAMDRKTNGEGVNLVVVTEAGLTFLRVKGRIKSVIRS